MDARGHQKPLGNTALHIVLREYFWGNCRGNSREMGFPQNKSTLFQEATQDRKRRALEGRLRLLVGNGSSLRGKLRHRQGVDVRNAREKAHTTRHNIAPGCRVEVHGLDCSRVYLLPVAQPYMGDEPAVANLLEYTRYFRHFLGPLRNTLIVSAIR